MHAQRGIRTHLCRAGAAPPGRGAVWAQHDGAKPGLAPDTDPGGPAATRAGVCTAGSLARHAAGTAPPGRETVRAPHDGSKPGLAPSGGAAATGLNGAQVAHAAPEKRGGGAAATGPNGAQVARTALEWGGGGAAATGFNGAQVARATP